jgi:hypothetical protein
VCVFSVYLDSNSRLSLFLACVSGAMGYTSVLDKHSTLLIGKVLGENVAQLLPVLLLLVLRSRHDSEPHRPDFL